MTVVLIVLSLLGIYLSKTKSEYILMYLPKNRIWTDLCLFLILAFSSHVIQYGEEFRLFVLPLIFLFFNLKRDVSHSTGILLVLILTSIILTQYFGWNNLVPPIFSLILSLLINVNRVRIILSLGIVAVLIFWTLLANTSVADLFTVLSPILLMLVIFLGVKTRLFPLIEFTMYISATYLVGFFPLLNGTLSFYIGLVLLIILLFLKGDYKEIVPWVVLLLPSFVHDQPGVPYYQVFLLLVFPILYDILHLVMEEIRSFDANSKEKFFFSVYQIFLLITFVISFSGHKGSILYPYYLKPLKLYGHVFLILITLFYPLKLFFVKERRPNVPSLNKIYVIGRSFLLFIAILLFSKDSGGFKPFALGCGALFLILSFFLKRNAIMFEKLQDFFKSKELPLIFVSSNNNNYFPEKKIKNTSSYSIRGWNGYSATVELSIIFFLLFLYIAWGGM